MVQPACIKSPLSLLSRIFVILVSLSIFNCLVNVCFQDHQVGVVLLQLVLQLTMAHQHGESLVILGGEKPTMLEERQRAGETLLPTPSNLVRK